MKEGIPAVPEKQLENNCATSGHDYNSFCSNPCYSIIADGYKYTVNSGTCLSYFDKFVGCSSNADCLGVCDQGFCKPSCSSTDECTANSTCSASTTTCQPVASGMACKSNVSTTIRQFSLRGALYPWLTVCAKNENGDYCMRFADSVADPSSLTCNNTESWGCCLGTILKTYSDCLGQKFHNEAIYSCSNSKSLCSGLPKTLDFCSGADFVSPKFLLLALIFIHMYLFSTS